MTIPHIFEDHKIGFASDFEENFEAIDNVSNDIPLAVHVIKDQSKYTMNIQINQIPETM